MAQHAHERGVKNRVAIFGGSFDPPHLGHVLVAAWAASMGEVDRVLVVPTYSHALGKVAGASFDTRVEMCEAALNSIEGVSVSRVEADLGGTSRTFHTLEALRSELSGAEFRLLIGSDILAETDRWYRWSEVASMAPPLVIRREGYPYGDEREPALPGVSSTAVRAAIARADRIVDAWVPASVRAIIARDGLYASPSVQADANVTQATAEPSS